MSAWDNHDAGEAVMTSRLLDRVRQLECERDKALAACREHEMLASEIVSDALDPSVNVAWMRCSPDLPKYVRALEAAAGEMRTLMQAMVDSMPAQEGGSLFYERFDGDGNYIGSENIDPLGLIGDWYQRALKGISTDCGKGWLSPEKAKEIERNAEILADDANGRCASAMRRANEFQAQVKLLVEALEKARHAMHWHTWHEYDDRDSMEAKTSTAVDNALAAVKGQP